MGVGEGEGRHHWNTARDSGRLEEGAQGSSRSSATRAGWLPYRWSWTSRRRPCTTNGSRIACSATSGTADGKEKLAWKIWRKHHGSTILEIRFSFYLFGVCHKFSGTCPHQKRLRSCCVKPPACWHFKIHLLSIVVVTCSLFKRIFGRVKSLMCTTCSRHYWLYPKHVAYQTKVASFYVDDLPITITLWLFNIAMENDMAHL